MRAQVKKLLLNILTGVALATAVVMIPAAAIAATAEATTAANVRSGPGTGYRIIDTLRAGELVDVLGCSVSWCELDEGGFVARSLLRLAGGGGSLVINPNVSFGISIGSGGFSIGIGTGDAPSGVGGLGGDVCFYRDVNYAGPRFCLDEGESIRRLGSWNDQISSIRNPDGFEVVVCRDSSYRGECRIYHGSTRSLRGFNDVISSIRVRD